MAMSGGTAGKVRAALAQLVEGDEALQGEACTQLRSLAANSAGKVALMQAKAADPLTKFILGAADNAKAKKEYLATGVAAAASCIAGLSTLHSGKQLVGVALELVPSLCVVMEHAAYEGRGEAAAALDHLIAINPSCEKAIAEFKGTLHLSNMLEAESMVVRESALQLLRTLSVRQTGMREITSDPKMLHRIITMLETGSQKCQENVAVILRQCCVNDDNRAHITRSGAPDILQRLMQYTTSSAVKDACQTALSVLWASTYARETDSLASTSMPNSSLTDEPAAPSAPAPPEAPPALPFPEASANPASARMDAAPTPPTGSTETRDATRFDAPAPATSFDAPAHAELGFEGGAGLGLSSTSGLGGLSSTSGLGNLGYRASGTHASPDFLDSSFRDGFGMQGGAVEESRWRAEAVQSVPEVAAHVPPHPGAIATAQDGVEPTPTRVSPPVLEAQPSALMEDNFGYNARQLEDFAKGANLLSVDEYTWDGKSGPGASSSALADLEDVIPLVGLLQTGDESEKQTALMALKSLAIDHQQALMEADVVGPIVKILDRAGKIAGVQGLDADGCGVFEAASILNSLWRWGRPQERAHLEKSALEVLDGLVQLLYSGTVRGKEQAASALGILGAMSDSIKLAFAEAGAVKPLVKLLRTGSASSKEEAEGVLWTLLAMNKDNSNLVRLSVEAAADMVLLMGTTDLLAKEAASVIRNLIPHNRTTLIQAGVVEGLMQVLHGAGAKCTGDGVGISEAATSLEVLARGDTRISAIALEALPGIIALLMRGTQTGREQAVGAMWALSSVNDRCKVTMVEEGAVNLLVDMLGKGANRQVDETTAGVLYSLLAVNARSSRKFWSRYSDGRTDQEVSLTLAAAKGLVPLLHTGSELMREAAAGVVNLCATSDRNRVNIMRARAVEPLVELLHTGSEGAREQAGSAIKALVDFADPVDGREPFEGAKAAAEAVEQLVSTQMDYLTADKSLAALLEQVVYDAFDRHVEAHTYVFEGIEQEWDLQGSRLVPELRSLRERGLNNWRGGQPMVELLTFANDETRMRGATGLASLSVMTKMELIEAGCLRQLVDIVGSILAEPLIALIMKACEHPEAEGMSAYAQAIAYLGSKDTRVARMAEDAVPPIVPVLESGTPKAREEAVTSVQVLISLGEPIKVLVAKMGMFGPLVELLGTGTTKTKEMAAWCLEALTQLMADCNVEVNISRTAAMDLVKIMENGTQTAAEAALGVLYNICNSDSNKSVLLHNKFVESVVMQLVEGSPASRVKAAKILRRLTVYGQHAERFLHVEEIQEKQAKNLQTAEQNTAGIMGGFFSSLSMSLTTPTSTPGFTPAIEVSMAGGPQQQAERLIQVLLAREKGEAKPSDSSSADHLAALLQRLIYDIFESSSAFCLNKPVTIEPLPQEEEYPPLHAPAYIGQGQEERPIFDDGRDGHMSLPAPGPVHHMSGEAMDGAITAEMAPPTRPVGTTALAFAGKKPLVKPRSKASMDVRPLVQLLHAGTDETKLLALEAVQSLNVSTQVAVIEAGALRPLVELLGIGAAKALVAFLSTAPSDPDGESVSDAARALCALASRDVAAAQAAVQCVDGLVALLLSGTDKGREEAAAALWSLSITNSKLKMAVAHAGAIPPMLTLLGAGTAAGKEEAAGVLWTLLSHEDERQASIDVKITMANALDLVHILTCGTDMGKEAAAGTIRLTALLDLNKGPLIQAMTIEPLVELLYASHEGVRAQCAGALRNLAVFQPNVYKDSRPELSKAAGEVKRMVAIQLDPASSSQYGAAVLAQLIYDSFDLALKVRTPGTLGTSGSVDPGGEEEEMLRNAVRKSAADQEAQEVLEDSSAAEPARRGAMQRMEANKRIAVMVELLRIAPADQKRFLSPVLACLGLGTKMALLKGGALYPYVELMGSDAGRPLAQLVVNACKTGDHAELGITAGALSSLAATDNSLNSLCARCVPGLVNMLEHGEIEMKEEAAHALKYFSIISFNMKVQIAEAGAFRPLVNVLGDGTPRAKEGAAGALWRLVSMMNESNIEVNISTKKAADLVVMLHASNPEGKEAAAGVLRLVAYNDANKLSIMRARAVEPLVDLLESQHPEVKEQAIGALNAIVADKENRKRIVRAAEQVDRIVALQSQPATANPQLAALLEYMMYDVYDMRRESIAESNGDAGPSTDTAHDDNGNVTAAAALGGYGAAASDGGPAPVGQEELNKLRMRGRVLGGSKEANRGLLPLVQLLQTGADKVKRMAAPALAVMRTSTKVALMEAGATRPLVQLLGAASAKALVVMLSRAMRMADGAGLGGGTSVSELAHELVECFMGLAEGDPRIAAMAAGVGGVVPQLIQLLETGSPAGQEQAAGALRSLSVINKNINVTIAREGAFEPLVKLLGTGTAAAREQAAGTLWRQLEMMRENAIEVNISVPRVANLVDMLRQGTEQGKEAAAAVIRYCANSEHNRANIMRGKAAEVLVDLLQTSSPKVRLQIGLALRAMVRMDDPGSDGRMVPLGPHSNWILRASTEAQALIDLIEDGSLQEGAHVHYNIAPSDGGAPVGNAPTVDPAAGGELNPEAPTHESMEKVLAVSKTQTLSAGAQQVAALLEQLMYDLFALRLAPLTDAPEAGGAVEGRVHNPHDVYLQCVSEGQATAVFRMLLQLLHNGAEDTKRLARDALQWLSMNTQVAFIEAGALKPLVEILGTGAAPAVVQMLADSVVAKEGVGVVDAARALRTLATDNGAVAGMAAGCIKGLVGLMEMGVFGGKEEAVRALWSLSVVNNELKYAIGQQGGLQPLVEMLYTGKESFRDEVVGLLWSLAMHDGNLESIIDVGAASGLVKVLHTGSEVAQEAAAGVLRLCAVVDNNKSSIIWAKAVEPLVDCMNLWNEGIREQAAGALRNLATWQTIDDSITEAASEVEKLVEVRLVQARLERMVQLPNNSGKQNIAALLERLILDIFDKVSAHKAGVTQTGHPSAVLSAANAALIYGGDHPATHAANAGQVVEVSKLPTSNSPGAEGELMDGGKDGKPPRGRSLPFIVQLLQDGTDEVKGQSAGAIKNLDIITKISIIEAGALRPMVELIGSHALEAILQLIKSLDPGGEGGDVAEYAAALARLGRNSAEDAVRADEAVRPIVQLLELGMKRGKQEAATALHCLCSIGDQIKFAVAREGAFEPLVKLLSNGTIKAKEEALGVLWQLVAMMAESNVDVNISPGPAADIAALLTSGMETTAVAAAGVLKLCAVAETNQKVILKANALRTMLEVLCAGAASVREQAAGALVNLAITDRGWCQDAWLVAAASEVEQLVKLLQMDAISSTPGIHDPKGAQRQVMALLEQLIVDVAEFRALYYAAQRGQALPAPSTSHQAPIASDKLEGADGAEAADQTANVEATGEDSDLKHATVPLRETHVMDETEEQINARMQLIVHLLMKGEEPVLQVATSALRALGVDTKVALIEQGAMKPVVQMMGPAAANALVELIGRASHDVAGKNAGDYASALRNLAAADPECAQMAMGCVQRVTHLMQRGGHKGKEEAAAAMWNLSTINEPIKTAIVESGALPHLIDLVNQGSPLARESAAGCLWSMSVVNVSIKELAARCGATGPLVELLLSGSATAREEACGALWSLSMREEATPEMIAHGGAKAAVELMYSGTEMGKESAAGLLGLCAVVDANKRAIFEARAVEPLISLLTGEADGARMQAASALKNLVTFRSAVPRAVDRGVSEVEDLVQKVMPSSGKQLVASFYSASSNVASLMGTAESNPLAAVLEQLMYDLFDMATAAAVASARELGESVPAGVSEPVGRDRSARPLVNLLLMDAYGVKQQAAGGLMCLSVNTKMALIEGGALSELVELLGSGAAKAIVQLLAGAGRARPDGAGVMELVQALCGLAKQDSRVAAVAVGAVPGLVELLQAGNGAGKEQAAGALYYLRHINPNVEALIQQARVVEQLVEILGMGTAAGKETPAMLCVLWNLITLPEGSFDTISENTAANLVQLLYTGTDVGKEGSTRVIRMLGVDEGNRAAIMRARAVEPLVDLLQSAGTVTRDEAAGALMSLSNQGGQATPQGLATQASGQTNGWFGNMFGAKTPAGASVVPSASSGSYGDDEAVRSAEAEVKELITMLRQVESAGGYQAPVMQGGSIQRQRKAAARLEQLMYYLFHAKTSYIVM